MSPAISPIRTDDAVNEGTKGDILRWYVGVPICTNPLILLDLCTVSALLWAFVVLAAASLQFFFAGALTVVQIIGAVHFALYLVLLIWGIFFVVSLIFLQNRYAALYRIDKEGVYCENMRKGSISLGESFHWKPFTVQPIIDPKKSTTKHFSWNDLKSARPLKEMRVILLKSERGAAMRVYCPDESVFESAVCILSKRLK